LDRGAGRFLFDLIDGSERWGGRKEWSHFDQVTEDIDPHLYEVAHVQDSGQQA
jgi:hypothetical protein